MIKYLITKKGELPYSETFILTLHNTLGDDSLLLAGDPPYFDYRGPGAPQSPLYDIVRRAIWAASRRLTDFPTRIAFREELRRVDPEVVLAQFGPSGVRLMDPCHDLNIPLVTFFHGWDASERRTLKNYQEDYKVLFNRSAALVAVSRSIRHTLLQLGAPEDRVFVSPCGADCTMFGPTEIRSDPFTFLFVGRFVDKKAPHLTILAFEEVLESFPNAQLRMIGGGPLLGTCASLAKARGLAGNVTLLGKHSHGEVQTEMEKASAYVQHSLTVARGQSRGDQEGTPVSIMEAGASGLPVVSTRHAGIPDVVVDEETGLLVNEGDVEGMARAMKHLVANTRQVREMGKRASDRIHTHFDAVKLSRRVRRIADWAIDSNNSKPSLVPSWLERGWVPQGPGFV